MRRTQRRGYLAAATISRNGFALDSEALRHSQGQHIRLWGYVDHGNLYGDAGARSILAEWWSGDGPNPATWRFNLKAREDDATGRSFAVYVPNDPGREAVLQTFVADARAGKPTRVFLSGRLFTFDAPTSGAVLTGVYLALQSSREILFGLPEDHRTPSRSGGTDLQGRGTRQAGWQPLLSLQHPVEEHAGQPEKATAGGTKRLGQGAQ